MRALVVAALVMFAGCAGASDPRPIAEDVVCLAEGDLGCVRVRVDDGTPRAEYEGVTYYFCAERCRRKFAADPARYVRR